MNIGFDLDKVFIDYPPLVPDWVLDRLYKKKSNGTLLYRIPSQPEQVFRRITHKSFLRPPIKKNISFLQRISKENNKLYLISSRFDFLEDITLTLMKRHGFDKIFDGMYFNFKNEQPHEFKDRILQKLHLNTYVDDDFHLLKYVAKRHKKTTFFWLTNTKHNHLITRNIIAIHSLPEILTYHYDTA
jgi:FMN phosphatase YigB (HAD superfamily)